MASRGSRADYRYQQPPVERHYRLIRPPARDNISKCVKYALFSFNFFFWLIGLIITCLGIWISFDLKQKEVKSHLDVFLDPAILLSILGSFLFVLGFFGCLGALRENICLLKTFQGILISLMSTEVSLATSVLVFYYVPAINEQLGFLDPEDTLKHAVVKYRDDDDLRDLIDTFQRKFKCCGVANSDIGYKDWQKNIYFNCTDDNPSVERCGVPHSCCKIEDGELVNVMCGFDTTDKEISEIEDKIYTQGCVKGFGEWIEMNAFLVGGFCLAAVIPQLLGVCFARRLVQQIKQQKAQWS